MPIDPNSPPWAVDETPTVARAEDPALRVAKLGFVAFDTPDVARLTEYYSTVLGFALVDESPEQVFLTTGPDHHAVVINKAEVAAGRTYLGWEINGTLDDAERRLKEVGLTAERRTDLSPGVPAALVLNEAVTGTALHLYEGQNPSGVVATWDQRPSRLGHVASFTPSTNKMRSFYQEALGFRWSDTIGDFFVFLRCNADHHAANFMQSDKVTGMHHIAYEYRNLDHLQTVLDNLSRHGHQLYWGPGRHGPGHNIFTYHEDPDGNHVELYTQMDIMLDEENNTWEPQPWHEYFPMQPRTWEVDIAIGNMWGPANPAGHRR
jgi:catechol-2,3-dioxygenase